MPTAYSHYLDTSGQKIIKCRLYLKILKSEIRSPIQFHFSAEAGRRAQHWI